MAGYLIESIDLQCLTITQQTGYSYFYLASKSDNNVMENILTQALCLPPTQVIDTNTGDC